MSAGYAFLVGLVVGWSAACALIVCFLGDPEKFR